ncbi:glycoside hydrolase family 172 protein [Pirellulimonas nuda]|uniref:glycoside hydrolase family 172 protein n=1 Tax=Pirellulimonas nuda TaxID=2528009 RepID=UPI00119E3788|nr:glycoside hydrolase family 172 protein [Pirellulimonas nuda]
MLAALLAAATDNMTLAQTVTFDSLLDDMLDRDALAVHPNANASFTLKQRSSYDRGSVAPDQAGWFANSDWSNYIRSEVNQGRTEWVLLDETGPGAVTRIWVGGRPEQAATLRFYLDGSSTPFWSGTAEDLVGKNSAMGAYLSWRSVDADLTPAGNSPGQNLYAPIPYSSGLKITFDHTPGGTSNGLWYNINYRTYEPGAAVTSFDPSEPTEAATAAKLAAVNSQLMSPDTAPRGAGLQQHSTTGALGNGQALSQALTGASAVKRLKLNLQAADMAAAIKDTELQISFDGRTTVRVPVGQFFGSGTNQINEVQDWYRTVNPTSGDMTSYWTMPFQNAADIRVVNNGSQNVTVGLEVETGDWNWTDDSMYFHSNYRKTDSPLVGGNHEDWNFVSILGEGVYVGDTFQITTGEDNSPVWWGEGDEKIYVDGEAFPSHFGTGTEDYYGYAWGGRHPETFNHAFVTQPESGANRAVGTTVNGRVRALDTIPFDESLHFDMEFWSNAGGDYDLSVATMWYGKPGAFAVGYEKLGDLNFNGTLDVQDWVLFRNGFDTDLAGLTKGDAYLRGDLDLDGDADVDDFSLFKQAYEAENGAGSLAAVWVPEPGALQLAAFASLSLAMKHLGRGSHLHSKDVNSNDRPARLAVPTPDPY